MANDGEGSVCDHGVVQTARVPPAAAAEIPTVYGSSESVVHLQPVGLQLQHGALPSPQVAAVGHVMTTFPYTLEHVAGDANVWADLLSRWGAAPLPAQVARIWDPDKAVDLQQKICIIAHQGAAGYRGVDVTQKGVLDRFDWATAKEDIKAFVGGCLHCLCVDGVVVPRPWGAALHAERHNELIYFDWLQLPPASNGWKYVLVVKDDMSGFCRLFPSATADAENGGSHFKKEVVDKIKKKIGAHHHITTPYTPWANGTVEVVNSLVKRGFKTHLSEMKLRPDEWHRVLPLVQSSLDHQSADRLGGVSPVTAFQGLPSTPPISGFVHPRTKEVETVDWLANTRKKHMAELRQALDDLHLMSHCKARSYAGKPGTCMGERRTSAWRKFAVGDIVLVGWVLKYPNKLALNWKGPYRVSRADSDYVMEVQQLVEPYEISLHHASRLKFFCDADLDVTSDPVDYAAFGDEGFYVEALLAARCNEGRHEVLVKWKGLEGEEASWEPASQLYEDIAVVMRRWILKNAGKEEIKALLAALEETLGHSL
ncbi:hypothetical protein H310_14305 [Aphanomyces invadans]|uniref:Chromo domain-containing protein n=1 Tax=Aphanomyces invadans TaxID=157072 RepID=A0A024TBJ5_9STRA|nr:hypothetical protein H310_14305 [Aphanomyces invadans]ETV90961.1 hypothetical protein H310_14305 [Aphanomyces invadans]|eukprot:XP_008880350.1 hypothetical protein H310_14305 [Aphanomyces invadans]